MHKFTRKIVELANVCKKQQTDKLAPNSHTPFQFVKGTVNGTPVNIIEKTVFMPASLLLAGIL